MIRINLDKAKNIVHEKRREARVEEFKPLDIQATIPAKAMEAESARQEIREKYAQIQLHIDSAEDIDTLKSIINNL